jgi:dephospho-CoA kinase
MKTIYLAIAGAQGSGKSLFCEIAENEFGFQRYRLGDIIIQECKKRNLEINGRNMAKMAIVLRYENGPQAIAKKALPFIKKFKKQGAKKIIIDGIRSYAELTRIREELTNVPLVAIITSLERRKARIEARKRIDHETKFDFEEREQRELSFGLAEVITKADFYILNEKLTKDEFYTQIRKLLQNISEQ